MSVKHWMIKFALSLAVLTSLPAFGAGFALYEGSAKGNVVGGIGGSKDPATIFYNPAAITRLEGRHFSAGLTLIAPRASLDMIDLIYDPNPTQAISGTYDDQVFTPPHIYYSHQLTDNLWFAGGIYTRWGLGTRYDSAEWAGRYSNIDTQVETLTINPNIAYKVNDRLSVSAGLRYIWFDAKIEQAIDASVFLGELNNNPATFEYDAVQTLEADANGFGFNLSAHYQINDRIDVGISYLSEVEQDLDDGTAKFQRPSAAVPDTWFVDTNASADPIDLPEMIMIGFHFVLSDIIKMDVGAIQTKWSSITDLTFNYENPIVVVPGLNLALDRVTRRLDWEDSWRYQVGFDWDLSPTWDLLWGVTFDRSAVPRDTISYLLPSNDRTLINLGARLNWGEWIVDVGYNYLILTDRNINYGNSPEGLATHFERQLAEGVFRTSISDAGAHILGASFTRQF